MKKNNFNEVNNLYDVEFELFILLIEISNLYDYDYIEKNNLLIHDNLKNFYYKSIFYNINKYSYILYIDTINDAFWNPDSSNLDDDNVNKQRQHFLNKKYTENNNNKKLEKTYKIDKKINEIISTPDNISIQINNLNIIYNTSNTDNNIINNIIMKIDNDEIFTLNEKDITKLKEMYNNHIISPKNILIR